MAVCIDNSLYRQLGASWKLYFPVHNALYLNKGITVPKIVFEEVNRRFYGCIFVECRRVSGAVNDIYDHKVNSLTTKDNFKCSFNIAILTHNFTFFLCRVFEMLYMRGYAVANW